MGYWTHHTKEKDEHGELRDDFMGIMASDPSKEVEYMAVVTFVFMLLDSGLSVSKLCAALDQVAEHIPEEHTAITTNSMGRARMAVSLVEEFLLKDSFERGKKKED